MPRFLKRILIGLGVVVGVFLLMQLVPYGREHTNPPVRGEPKWDSQVTRALAERACFDCHSNQTKWPWYTHVAPMSWVTLHHVNTGRSVLNFSEWDPDWVSKYPLAEQSGSQILRTEMPPRSYRMLHPEAQLSDNEKVQLAKGLHATLGIEWRE